MGTPTEIPSEPPPPPPPQQPPPPPPKNRFNDAVDDAQAAGSEALESGNSQDIAAAEAQWGEVATLAQDQFRRAAASAPGEDGVPAAVDDRRQELAETLESNNVDPGIRTQVLEQAEASVLQETPEQRESRIALSDAQSALPRATSEWEAAQTWSEAQRQASPALQQRYEAAQTNYTAAEQNIGTALNDVVDADLDARLQKLYPDVEDGAYTDAQLQEAGSEVKAAYGGTPEVEQLVDFRVAVQGREGEVQTWIDKIENDPSSLDLTDAERALAESDPVTLAFLKTAGVTLELDKAEDPSLSQAEIALGESDPVLFAFMQMRDARFHMEGNSLEVEVGGEAYSLTPEERTAYEEGGIPALAMQMGTPLFENPEMAALVEVIDPIRTTYASERLPQYEGAERLAFVNTQLRGFFSPEARAAFWNDTALPAIKPELEAGINGVQPEEGFEQAYLTYLGEHVNGLLEGATPEVAGLVLDLTMARVDSYDSGDVPPVAATAFLEAMSTGVSIADQAPGSNRAQEVAEWFMQDGRTFGLLDMNSGSKFRQIITDTGNYELGEALVAQVEAQDGYTDQFVLGLREGVEGGKADGSEKIAENQAEAAYEALMDPAFHDETINNYFDGFTDTPGIGTPVSTENTPELRNIIGQSLGFEPAGSPEAGGDLFAEGTRERAIIDLIATWIEDQDGEGGATVTAVPIIYASQRHGVEYGALFKITKADGSEVIIDGLMAEDAFLAEAAENEIDPQDTEKVFSQDMEADDVNVSWHYDSLDDFTDENHYDTDGKIYIPENLTLSDADGDGHVDWVERDAARKTTGEWVKDGIDVLTLVGGTVAGIALAPVTGGGSLAATAAVWTAVAGSAGWQIYRGHEMRAEMAEHGQSTDWSNPNARSTYLQQGMALFSLVPMAASARAMNLTRTGTNSVALGQASRNPALTAQGYARLDRAVPYGQVARYTGYANMAAGTWFMAEQASALVRNWDRMSTYDRVLNAFYVGFGASQFGIGAAAARVPALSRRLAGNGSGNRDDVAYLASVNAAREASDLGRPLDPDIGTYITLDDGTVNFIPNRGKPITIHPAETPVSRAPAGQQTADQPVLGRIGRYASYANMAIGVNLMARHAHALVHGWNGMSPTTRMEHAVYFTFGALEFGVGAAHFIPNKGKTGNPPGPQAEAPRSIGMRYTRFDPEAGEYRVIDTGKPVGERVTRLDTPFTGDRLNERVDDRATEIARENHRWTWRFRSGRYQNQARGEISAEDGVLLGRPSEPEGLSTYLGERADAINNRASELWDQAGRPEGGEASYRPLAEREIDEALHFDNVTNRQYVEEVDPGTGVTRTRPIDPGNRAAFYAPGENVTYVLDPETGRLGFFGLGDNRRGFSADRDLLPDGSTAPFYVRDTDPVTGTTRYIESTGEDLVFYDPGADRTFSMDPTSGRATYHENGPPPAASFHEGARFYNRNYNREYVYRNGRFEPLDPDGKPIYYHEESNQTFIQNGDGLEFLGMGDYRLDPDQPTGLPGGTVPRAPKEETLSWHFFPEQNRTYAVDLQTGRFRPLDSGDHVTHYDAAENVTWLIDLANGEAIYFGRGDNRRGRPDFVEKPDLTLPHWQQRAPDIRLGLTGRLRIPASQFLPIIGSPTAASAGVAVSTKTNWRRIRSNPGGELQTSIRLREWQNTTLAAWKLWFGSKQTAFQLKGATLINEIKAALTGAEGGPFVVNVNSVEHVGQHDRGPSPVYELSFNVKLNTDEVTLQEGRTNFFGGTAPDGYEVPAGIPFNKVQSELKLGIPRFVRDLVWEITASTVTNPLTGKKEKVGGTTIPRFGLELRPELPLPGGIPARSVMPREFHEQAQSALSKVDVRMQLVVHDPEVVPQLRDIVSLRKLIEDGKVSLDESQFQLPRFGGGTRLSAVVGKQAFKHGTDLTGRTQTRWDPEQANVEVFFNDRFSTRGFDRVPNLDRAMNRVPGLRRMISVSEPEFLPLNGSLWRSIADPQSKAPSRITVSAATPILIVANGEFRAAIKTNPEKKPVDDVADPDYGSFMSEGASDGSTRPHIPMRFGTIPGGTRRGEGANGVLTTHRIPMWFSTMLARARRGEGAIIPTGARDALEAQFLADLETRATPAQLEAVASFRETILPKLQEGAYLTDEIVAGIDTLLTPFKMGNA